MRYISPALRKLVTRRCQNRCEYCGLSQAGQEATFHIDHVIPVSTGGRTDLENLALACVSCSLRKSAREKAIDPETGRNVSLFNPRRHNWRDHFKWKGMKIEGITPVGRATIKALDMNRPLILAIREEELILGRPPWFYVGEKE